MFSTIAPYYNKIFPYKPFRADFLEKQVLNKPVKILDIGCATGGFVIDLANRGHHAIGIDLDPEMISIARKNGKSTGAKFEVMDMLHIDEKFVASHFDVITCLGNTLVQLEHYNKINFFLSKVKKLLKPSGKLIVQIVNYDKILEGQIESLPKIENQELEFYRNYAFSKNSSMLKFTTKIIDKINKKEIINSTNLYPIRSEELQEFLLLAGFSEFQFFGDYDLRNFDSESPAIIAVATAN